MLYTGEFWQYILLAAASFLRSAIYVILFAIHFDAVLDPKAQQDFLFHFEGVPAVAVNTE